MPPIRTRSDTMYGQADLGSSRYVVLYLAQVGWLALGAYLYSHAYWPSSCNPDSFLKVYSCSFALPENRGWVEASLMTWLWSTPILVVLEVMRRSQRARRR